MRAGLPRSADRCATQHPTRQPRRSRSGARAPRHPTTDRPQEGCLARQLEWAVVPKSRPDLTSAVPTQDAVRSRKKQASPAWRPTLSATMIHTWKKAMREGAFGVFGRGGRKVPEIGEKQVKELPG